MVSVLLNTRLKTLAMFLGLQPRGHEFQSRTGEKLERHVTLGALTEAAGPTASILREGHDKDQSRSLFAALPTPCRISIHPCSLLPSREELARREQVPAGLTKVSEK